MLRDALSFSLSVSIYLILVLVAQNDANAITTYTEKITCPLNGKVTEIMKYRSYSFVGRRLDTKAILLGSPQVLPLPVCRENGFAIYKDNFNDEELEKARELVKSLKFIRLSRIHTSHYLGAIEAETLGESQFRIARLYQFASWEAEEIMANRTRNYMSRSLKYFLLFLKSHDEQDDRWLVAQLLSANLERKLGRFRQAINRIKALSMENFGKTSRAYLTAKKILQYSKQKNTQPQKL